MSLDRLHRLAYVTAHHACREYDIALRSPRSRVARIPSDSWKADLHVLSDLKPESVLSPTSCDYRLS